MRRAPAPARVEDMFEQIKSKLPGAPRFLLCLLPERKNSDIYGFFIFVFSLKLSYVSASIFVYNGYHIKC